MFANVIEHNGPMHIRVTRIDAMPLDVDGPHKGKEPQQVAEADPYYIVWLYENIHPPRCSLELYKACCAAYLEGLAA